MVKDQRKITILLSVVLILFTVTVAYAITSGVLAFTGTATFQNHTEVVFTNASIDGVKDGESVIISPDGRSLVFTTIVATPGESRIIHFNLQNIGNQAAQLGALNTSDPGLGSGVIVTWPNLDNVVLSIGATSSLYSIVVTWDSNYPGVTGAVQYSASLDFQQYIP